jgi:peptidyl-prolyl cis-trans isomerase C
MRKLFPVTAGATLALCLALPIASWAQTATEAPVEATPDTVVATVNGVNITVGHMIVAMQTLPAEYSQLDDQTLFDGILNQLVQQEALAQKFKETMPPRVVYSLENEKRSLVAAEVIEQAMGVPLEEAEIQAIYDERYGSIEAEDEFNASHILVETEEDAKAIKEELDAGGNFAQVAREKSTGPSGPNGGELGWFSSGMMVPDFEAAVIALKPGEISAPVQTQFGWHVILLNETRKADIPTLEDTRSEIEIELRRGIANTAIELAADEADVVVAPGDGIDAGVIRRIDLLQ